MVFTILEAKAVALIFIYLKIKVRIPVQFNTTFVFFHEGKSLSSKTKHNEDVYSRVEV